jgi:hypothetical protein
LLGLLLVFANDAMIWGLENLARGPHRHVAGILVNVLNLAGPGLWLLAVALGLLLTTGRARPAWTQGRWLLAGAVVYFFHIPLMLFMLPTIFGRWGHTMYLVIGSVGAVCALRLLCGSLHLAAFFLLAEPVVRNVTWGHVHHATRSLTMTGFAVVGFALVGWWLRDAGASPRPPTATVPQLPRKTAIADGCL